jgi:tRNA dimethylallyltransferase
LAKKFNGEIISADSRQIYRGMNIGTAKPTEEELDDVKHYLINIKNPDQDYSVSQFKKDALKAIGKIIKAGKLPIIVGGTGLYVSAVVDNLSIPKVTENKDLRRQLEKEINEKGLDYVFKKLLKIDPEAIYIVDPKNPRRVVRALEVAFTTGKPFTAQRIKRKALFDFFQIGITQPSAVLKNRIAERANQMITNGLVNEVEILIKKYGDDAKVFDAIGYREIINYLKGDCSFEIAVEQMISNTSHYAKRQMTWFKRDKRIRWTENFREAEKLTSDFIG